MKAKTKLVKYTKFKLPKAIHLDLVNKKHVIHGYSDTIVSDMNPNIVYIIKAYGYRIPVFVNNDTVYSIKTTKEFITFEKEMSKNNDISIKDIIDMYNGMIIL